VDANDRYRLYCPTLQGPDDSEQCINVHSKVLIVDDELLTLGSANLASRSLCLDTECNIAIEAGEDAKVRSAIAGLRERLLAEHLGVAPQRVAAVTKHYGAPPGDCVSTSRTALAQDPPIRGRCHHRRDYSDTTSSIERPLDPTC
jgi:phosphatidylserine/phosphatidylglycerophosphate/cardiolipin synthase-like enzyme